MMLDCFVHQMLLSFALIYMLSALGQQQIAAFPSKDCGG
jgi:hypothetical protein